MSQDTSLRKRVEKSGAVFVGGFALRQAIRLGSNLILTRLLVPEAFGVMAAAISINILASQVSDIGVESSIIRSKHSDDPRYVRTAWTIRGLRNLFMYFLVLITAGGIALFSHLGRVPQESVFNDPVLPWIMLAVGSQFLIQTAGSINRSMAERKLQAGRVVVFELSSQIVMFIVTVSFAFSGFGVWSLVIGTLAGSLFSAVSSYYFFPGPAMGIQWDQAFVVEIFNFGKWLLLASFCGFLINRGDQLIFAWAFESREFGLYAVATIWIIAAVTVCETVMRRAFYPAYSELIRERRDRLASAYQKSRLIFDAGAAFVAFGVFFFSDFAISLVYPEEFWGVSYYMKLLSPMIMLVPYKLLGEIVIADGHTRYFSFITLVNGLAILIGTPLVMMAFGISAGVVFFACIRVASAPVAYIGARRSMPVSIMGELRILVPTAILLALLVASTGQGPAGG